MISRMVSRRNFLSSASKMGLAASSVPLWMNLASARAFAQSGTTYKAVVLVSLPGGNDGNNMLIPIDSSEYAEYASMRGVLAQPMGGLLPLTGTTNGTSYGLHSSMPNLAGLYNLKQAAFVANVGPIAQLATKAQIAQNQSLLPDALLSHPSQLAQWESATTEALPTTGWGGRMADQMQALSGSLPPVLDAGPSSVFTVGNSVQGISVQTNSGSLISLPAGMDSAILSVAQAESQSANDLIAASAKLRVISAQQQVVLNQAQSAGASLSTVFPGSSFGNVLKTIAQVINGRSVVGASRQIFYCTQGGYDLHENQWKSHAALLADLDAGLGAFMTAVGQMGLTDQVLVCTHSDFNRTMQPNSTNGTDHAWGNHQILLGGGIKGGRVLGSLPALELGGSSDLNGQGVWIPTTSVTQMTAGIGTWMGLNSSQLETVFPLLGNFPAGALAL